MKCFLTNSEADKHPRCLCSAPEVQGIPYSTCSMLSTDTSGPISRTIFYLEKQIMPGRRTLFQSRKASILSEILCLKELIGVFVLQNFIGFDSAVSTSDFI